MESETEPPDGVNLLLSQSLSTSDFNFFNHYQHYEKYLNKVNSGIVSNIEECYYLFNFFSKKQALFDFLSFDHSDYYQDKNLFYILLVKKI